MTRKTRIEWTDETWNPIRGCSHVSEGCRYCYAERIASRFSGPGQPFENIAYFDDSGEREGGDGPRWTGEVHLIEKNLDLPLRWRKPRRIFVNSVSDLFHEKVADEWIERIFAVMALARRHVFQILTKRPDRMRRLLSDCMLGSRVEQAAQQAARRVHPQAVLPDAGLTLPLPNVFFGVSVEDQKTADERISDLLLTPAAVRFVSSEPLLGPIDLSAYLGQGFRCDVCGHRFRSAEPHPRCPRCEEAAPDPDREPVYATTDPSLDWVIAGGETGPRARPMNPDWVRAIRDQCIVARVPFFFKGWGEYTSKKKSIRRILDGRMWDEMPGDKNASKDNL